MPKVTIIYRTIPQYRLEFYNLLREGLKSKGINLELIYGNNPFKGRDDDVHSDWATYKKNFTLNFYKLYIIWQPCLREVESSDLVIVEQANKLLFNYYLIFRKIFKKKKFAFWGHGLNLQISKTNIFNRFKLTYINRANWWFAYTEGIKSFLIKHGVDKEKITVVQNSIDTKSLNELYNSITYEEVEDFKLKYNIQKNQNVLIYCGALTKEKNIKFLIKAADNLKAKGYQFKLIIIGNGPLKKLVEKAVAENQWIIYAGPQFGREKALFFKASDIFLLPGAMGLAILDSFAFETPIVTMKYNHHGPEFEYIINDYNAIVSEGNLSDYTNKVANLLDNPEKITELKMTGRLMIEKYNIQFMVNNFIEGIEKALM
jgi:glycosyltransferase involved in cell wall biosynthesis